jgi:hypothetical protein
MGYAVATGLAMVLILVVAWRLGDRSFKSSVVEGVPCPKAVPVVAVFWVTAACVLIDSAFGGTLCKFSLPSSYQIAAYRFYGIGNEYAGALICMAALALLFSGKSIRRRAALPVGLVIVVFLGVGQLGANYGATLTAVVTFGLLWMAIGRGGFRVGHVIFWLATAVMVAAAFAVLDWKTSGAHATHAGQAGRAAGVVGANFWADLVGRKVLLNFKLTASGNAERAFLAFVPFIGLWLWKIHGRLGTVLGEDKSMVPGLQAIVVGSVVGYLANDSGVVLASIMLAMTVVVLLYSLLENGGRPWAES